MKKKKMKKHKTSPFHTTAILFLSQATRLISLSPHRQAGLEGQEVLREQQQLARTCEETLQLQAVPSYLLVISSAPDQQQTGYFIYLDAWIDVSWRMCHRRGEF